MNNNNNNSNHNNNDAYRLFLYFKFKVSAIGAKSSVWVVRVLAKHAFCNTGCLLNI